MKLHEALASPCNRFDSDTVALAAVRRSDSAGAMSKIGLANINGAIFEVERRYKRDGTPAPGWRVETNNVCLDYADLVADDWEVQ